MDRLYRFLTGTTAVAVFSVIAFTGTPVASAQAQGGQAAAAQPQKKVKDQGEYEIYNAVLKEADAAKKLQLLDQWVQKYPDTEFKDERLQLYNGVKAPAKVIEVGSSMLAKDPKNLTALVLVSANTPLLTDATPEQLESGKKAARYLLENLESLKPPAVADAAWAGAKPGLEANAHAALAFVALYPGQMAVKNKDFAGAETAFKAALAENPQSGQVAYSLGSAIISQKKAERYPEAIYYIARGASIDPEKGGLPDAMRKQVETYLNKVFTSYHGEDPQALAQLKEMAKASPTPPADYKLESAQEIATRKENEFREKNPQLALWLGIKKELVGPNGEAYFASNVKDAAVPPLKGTLLSFKPALRAKELVVAIENPQVGEVTLKLETPLAGKPKVGGQIEFEGVPAAFVKDPFMLTFDIADKSKIKGLEVEAPPRPAAKKSAARKKG